MSAEITETTAEEAAEATAEVTAAEVVEETAAVEETITEDAVVAEVVDEEVVADAEVEETADTVESSTIVVVPTSIADIKPKMKVKGTVKKVDLYGAIIDLGIDATALIHISKLGSEQVNRVSDVLKEGDTVEVWVEKVDPERQQIMLSMVEPLAVDWNDLKEGQTYKGTVTRLENFGAFVNIGAEREGLVHISELSHDYVKSPGEVVSVGDEVEVVVLGFNRRKRRIDLSMKALIERPANATGGGNSGGGGGGGRNSSQSYTPDASDYEALEDDYEELPTAMEIALRRALGNEGVGTAQAEQGSRNKQKKASTSKRQKQQEVIERIMQMQSEN